MDVELVTPESTRALRRTWLIQRWQDLTFVHWAVDPAQVAPLLPVGTRPDVIDGVTYVGLIGFRMVGLGAIGGPGVPWLGTFLETNVRLYSVDTVGRRAVVFLSLDAERLIPVLTAQLTLRLPYRWATMSLTRTGDDLVYRSRRRRPGSRGVASELAVTVGAPVSEPTALEHFLTARWGLHTRVLGQTIHLPNVHPRWPLHRATLTRLDDELVAAAGLTLPSGPPASVLYSPGVPVRFGPPGRVRATPDHLR